jgi:hypothetical protein
MNKISNLINIFWLGSWIYYILSVDSTSPYYINSGFIVVSEICSATAFVFFTQKGYVKDNYFKVFIILAISILLYLAIPQIVLIVYFWGSIVLRIISYHLAQKKHKIAQMSYIGKRMIFLIISATLGPLVIVIIAIPIIIILLFTVASDNSYSGTAGNNSGWLPLTLIIFYLLQIIEEVSELFNSKFRLLRMKRVNSRDK